MTFGAAELSVVLDECGEALAGARLKNVYDEGERGWIFRLYAGGENRFLYLGAQAFTTFLPPRRPAGLRQAASAAGP